MHLKLNSILAAFSLGFKGNQTQENAMVIFVWFIYKPIKPKRTPTMHVIGFWHAHNSATQPPTPLPITDPRNSAEPPRACILFKRLKYSAVAAGFCANTVCCYRYDYFHYTFGYGYGEVVDGTWCCKCYSCWTCCC